MRRLFELLVLVLAVVLTGCVKQEAKPDHKAGERMVKTVDGVEYAFRWCPAGTFLMGSPTNEISRCIDETQHQVTLTKGFWMLETEVTQAMWQSVMDSNPSVFFTGDNLPVMCVCWHACQEFCSKLSSKIGMKITLPTEAQWEYACRAGTTGPYAGDLDAMSWYGESDLDVMRQHKERKENGPDANGGYGRLHAVGQKKPNAWGLYDMHGNVWEWCEDLDGAYPNDAVTDPTGPNLGENRAIHDDGSDSEEEISDDYEDRIIRGGSCNDTAEYCRSAYRGSIFSTCNSIIQGFRVVACPE